MKQRLVAIDVGNTNVVIGLFDETMDVVDHWRVSTSTARTGDEWLVLLQQFLELRGLEVSDVSGVVLCSVVPQVTEALRRMCARLNVEPLVVNWKTDTGMPILLDDPSEVGADRIANAIAAFDLVRGRAIVVDMGTATTLDVVSEAGEYLGGVILPGIEISLEALFGRAAALSRIELFTPDRVVGSGTAAAVRSGVAFGYADQVDGLCRRIVEELGPCTVLGTGGQSTYVASTSTMISQFDPWLTLRGLGLVYRRHAHQ